MRWIAPWLVLVQLLAFTELVKGEDVVRLPEPASAQNLLERLEAAEKRIVELESGNLSKDDLPTAPDWTVGYDMGFFIRPTDKDEHPFELKINGRMQFRYVGFSRDSDTFLNRSGVVPVASRSDFEIERARLEFRGFFYDPKLEYYVNIDADTDDNHRAVFHDFWINYEFSKAFDLHVGKGKVPGSYEWLESSTSTRFADRSLATTFFRPDRSVGVWATGELADGLHYHAMIANGFNTTDLEPEDVDDQFAYSTMLYWDPWGDVGSGYSDLDYHENLVIRVGNAFTYADQNAADDGDPTAEERYARLSDGTPLITPGALAPGVTVNAFDTYLYTVFLTGKYRGFSFNAEYYARWLQDFGTKEGLPLPDAALFDSGFYADMGYMIIPKTLELNGRISQVDGLFGDAWEYAGGVNWFINGTHRHKLTFDVTVLDGSPASSSSPNFAIGQDGVLYQVQYQAAF